MTEQELKRFEAIEAELRVLREHASRVAIVQNPFWYGIVIKTVVAATNPLTGYKVGKAELLILDRASSGAPHALKASGKALEFVSRWKELTSLARGTLCLFARDWNKSLIVIPGCAADYVSLLTLDQNGNPL
jgi:hypothetical protein